MKYRRCNSGDTERVLSFLNHAKALWIEDDLSEVLISANETAVQKSARRLIILLFKMIVVYGKALSHSQIQMHGRHWLERLFGTC